MMKQSIIIIGFAFVIASLSCQNVVHLVGSEGVSKPQSATAKLHLPQPWLGETELAEFIAQIEVRKAPNSANDEFIFGALPDGDHFYAHEVNKNLPPPRYGKNMFAVNFSAGPRARVATQQEWASGSRIPTKPRLVVPNRGDSSAELEYRQKRYPKVGKYWGEGMLSPTGRWLAVFSYTGEKTPPDLLFGGGDVPFGDAFWQIYDTATGKKVFEWEAKGVKHPTYFKNPLVWLEDRYFLFPTDDTRQEFTVVTLPPLPPEVNPVMVQFPSRRDAGGQPLPAGDRDEVWIPLIPLTKEQAAKLTAPYPTEIKEVRVSRPPSAAELLLAINEETENRRTNRGGGDGAGDYHFKVVSTYYYAVSLDNPAQTRFATKAEWARGQTRRHNRSPDAPVPTAEKFKSPDWPYREFPKTGTTWGSPPVLGAGDWLAILSYDQQDPARPEGNLFVDIYDRLLGDKLMSTTLPSKFSANGSFKGALSIEGGYILLPLNASLDSFALWQLP